MATETAPHAATQTTPEAVTHTIVHVEVPAKDPGALCSFYSALFGWRFETAPGMDNYHMASTVPGEMAHGFAIYPKEGQAQLTNYVGVESVSTAAADVERLGGTVVHRFTVPGMGHGAVTLDPEGNSLGLWQPDVNAAP
jgi:uncharacterized protein